MSVIRDLAAFVVGASASALSPAERAAQRRHVADTLLATVAGSKTTEGRALRALLPRTSMADACGMFAAVTRHTEIDDIHLPSCTTPSSVTVPTALALARDGGDCDPEHVASAICVGTELMTRLGAAIDGPRILYRGVWPTYFAAPLAAAAVAARIWRLSEEETAHALSLGLMLGAGRSGRFQGKVPGRSVLLALAVTAGVRAADAARQGVGGDPDLLDGPWLRDAQGLQADMAALTAELGRGSVYAQLSLKQFCSAKQAATATDAFLGLLDEGLAVEAIPQVRVRVPPHYARMIATKAEAGSRSSTIVSAGFQLGLAATCRERLYDIERGDAIRDPRAIAFAQKVEIVPDEALLEVFPGCWPAEIEVSASGKTFCRRVNAAGGDPQRPFDDPQLKHKAQRVLEQLGDAESAASLVDTGLGGLEDRSSCQKLAEVMWACGK
jgi:2-methylcitrate dehydratase PrpD